MTARARLVLIALAFLVLVPAAVRLAWAMPTFGAHPLPYGDAIDALAPKLRMVTNAVSAVNYDFRGFDTLGEEFMLLAAVTGVVVLLRGSRGEGTLQRPGWVEGRRIPPRTDASVVTSRVLAPLVLVFGLYVCMHGSTTPGGGFQGGVIAASAILLVFMADGYAGWRAINKSQLLEWCEGGGALVFACLGFAPLLLHKAFSTNILPFGSLKSAASGGTIFADNAAVSFAVFGSFCIVFLEFMEETRAYKPGDSEPGADESGADESNDGGSKRTAEHGAGDH